LQTSFQEFLHQKIEGTDWKDRSRRRVEWLNALERLLDQIQEFLREADPEGLLETVPYEVQRVESRLGVYDAPALKVRIGTDSVDVVPEGRHATGPLLLQHLLLLPGNAQRWGDLSGGRVDITNGERRYLLLRSIVGDQDHWYATMSNKIDLTPFNSICLQAVLRDLLK
jgi:hypothetical protein